MDDLRTKLEIRGIVQGVGFRPFVHRLAGRFGLNGWVANTSAGAELELEGSEASINAFMEELRAHPPVLARIESIDRQDLQGLRHYAEFSIHSSEGSGSREALVSPDIGICDDCLRELNDPSDPRYRYPFINCTNCGPRFSIVKQIPYDRCNTSMSEFEMCSYCSHQYQDINDRRYHAQPVCCEDCGPALRLLDREGRQIGGDPIRETIGLLKRGAIAAIKGIGGYHLACICGSAELAEKLRKSKLRSDKPFAIMCRDAETAARYCFVSEDEKTALESFRKPIVLLRKRDPEAYSYISENGYIGVMLPYTPMHVLLLQGEIDSLILTSANLSDRPILCKDEEALSELADIADIFLLHDREIVTRCDDSLIRRINGRDYPIRRSRGYVPEPLSTDMAADGILALGAEQKASFALTKGRNVFVSQHIGDLKNLESFENYTEQIRNFEALFDIEPHTVVCDLHPDYLSTNYAEELEGSGLRLLKVQHHYAHMASCMEDNRITESCIGMIWDGTGYGTDGTIWGAEFLYGDFHGFSRKGSIRKIRLPGGDRAAKELWRIGISLLLDAGIQDSALFPEERWELCRKMLERGINVPPASSMGRLFDGIAAIAGICTEASYEGRGAVLLEACAAETARCYPYRIETEGLIEWDYRPMIREIYKDVQNGVGSSEIAAAFMNTLICMAAEIAGYIRKETGCGRVVLSGGSFQNIYVLERLKKKLSEEGFTVYCHSRVPANDEGISFGQAAIAKRMNKDVSCSST